MLAAERVTLETDAAGRLIRVPDLPPNSRLEAIFLVLGQAPLTGLAGQVRRRRPHPQLRGQVDLLGGDVMSSADADAWDLPK